MTKTKPPIEALNQFTVPDHQSPPGWSVMGPDGWICPSFESKDLALGLARALNANHSDLPPSEISGTKKLIEAVEESLSYFCDEFPDKWGKHAKVWESPISHHCGGITPHNLDGLLTHLYSTMPVMRYGTAHVDDDGRVSVVPNEPKTEQPVSVAVVISFLRKLELDPEYSGAEIQDQFTDDEIKRIVKAVLDAANVRHHD